MFKAKKLDRLVAVGIITQTQKLQILAFEEGKNGFPLVQKALAVLGVFMVGLGVISLVAANWYEFGGGVKLAVMFALLCGAVYMALRTEKAGQKFTAEKWRLGLFFLCGAAIGLIIQIFQLSGGKMYTPFGFWALVTLPLLFVSRQKLVSYFWMPLFLGWLFCFATDYLAEWLAYCPWVEEFAAEILLLLFLGLAGIGYAAEKLVPAFSGGSVLKKEALFVFYAGLFCYILTGGIDSFSGLPRLGYAAGVLAIWSVVLWLGKGYPLVRRNIKFAGWLIVMLYINLGKTLGLFETGVGLIIGGAGLLALLKYAPKAYKVVCGRVKNV